MYGFIGNLKNKVILNEKIILDLKSYIYNKYPDKGSKELSLILADGIHKIINNSMDKFQEELRAEIEKNLIREAVENSNFSITPYKVFCQYCRMDLGNDENIEQLHKWLCSNQDNPPDKDELIRFMNTVRAYDGSSIEDAIKYAEEIMLDENTSINEEQILNITPEINCSRVEKNNNIQLLKNRILQIPKEFIRAFEDEIMHRFKAYGRKGLLAAASLVMVLFTILYYKDISYSFKNTLGTLKITNTPEAANEIASAAEGEEKLENGLPEELQYIEVDKNLLRDWLLNRESMLAEEPYLTSILEIAEEYNINPLLMIAITGQEQGFVPKSHKNALKIVNNPFNVYESWAEYNTDIEDSTKIAAQTIINLSKDRPEDAHAIQWINNKYAEDKNWWVGVDKIFNRLKLEITK